MRPSPGVIAALLVASGCASSHAGPDSSTADASSAPDAGFDPGGLGRDAGDPDAAVGPVCEPAAPPPCFEVVASTDLSEVLSATTIVHAIAAGTSDAMVLISEQQGVASAGTRIELRRIAADGLVARRTLLEETEPDVPPWRVDGAVLFPSGRVDAAWRRIIRAPGGTITAIESRYVMDAEGAATRVHGIAREYPSGGAPVPVAVALSTLGADEVIVSAIPAGVAAGPIADPLRVRIDAGLSPWGALSASSAAGALWLAWAEEIDRYVTTVRVGRIGPDGVPSHALVFDRAELGGRRAALLAEDAGAFIARFEQREGALRQSWIRVAHVGEDLGRVEADRWFTGWGGLDPSGVAVVRFHGRPTLVWAAIDARYGRPALFVAPLPEEACGVPETAAVALLPAHRGTGLVAAVHEDDLWVGLSGETEYAEAYRIVACAPPP